MVQAIHTSVKGRVRFKVARLKRCAPLREEIEAQLNEKVGVSRFSVSTVTGSVLIIFNSDNTVHAFSSLIEEAAKRYRRAPTKTFRDTMPEVKTAAPTGGQPAPKPNGKKMSRHALRKSVLKAEEQVVQPWHHMDAGEVLSLFGVSPESGLSQRDAGMNIKKFGPNLLPESVPRSGFSIFFDQFKSLPVVLLAAAAVLSVATGGIADAVVIMSVVAMNGAIGYVTETQAEKTIQSLKSLVRPSAQVLRENAVQEIKAEDVTPGDILVLRPGSFIAADSRIIAATHLSVDESALTGESLPVTKKPMMLQTIDTALADRKNMVYMGTLVTGGQGLAVVVGTGRHTEIGRIQTLVGEAEPPATPMERQLDRMGTQLVFISGAVCGLVFLIGLLRGYGFLRMLKTSISLAVAAVPEGLPTVATTTLALGIRNMRKHNVLIRHLNAVETLGSVQTICLDKTGTITMNRMSVVAIHAGMSAIQVLEESFMSAGTKINPFLHEELLRLIHTTVLCNETEVAATEGGHVLSGTSTENAFIHMAVNAGIDVVSLREKYPLVRITHRSENLNYMTTLHRFVDQHTLVAVKGSPGELLSLSTWYLKDGQKHLLTEEDRLRIETENERMAGNALRVLGVAYCTIELDAEDLSLVQDIAACEEHGGLIWLGLVGMADPVRSGVKTLIGNFHAAGIDAVMITGDQSPTAYAIGKELDLSKGRQLEILDSTHLSNLEPQVLKALCERVHVFARVSPAHKLQIVQALQAAGKVVAMTGDGINDGPALKAADIGIAMGHTGTDVAREVADVVIEDDNLETMIIAISQGRTIYNNIRKSVHFLLSTNLSEIIVMFAAISGGMGEPLNAMQLLWINLISDIFPGLALALEPPEPDVLNRPPRNPDEPIITKGDLKRIGFESAVLSAGTLGAYGYGIARYGIGPQAGTLAFMTLSVAQLLHAISCRSEEHGIFDRSTQDRQPLKPNPYLTAALAGSLGLQFLTLAVPGLRGLLGLTPLSVTDSVVAGLGAVVPLLINESTKQTRKRSPGKDGEGRTVSDAVSHHIMEVPA